MIVRCPLCQRLYDDLDQWSLCPHGPLGFDVNDYCPKCDTLKSIQGSCIHQEIDCAESHD